MNIYLEREARTIDNDYKFLKATQFQNTTKSRKII